MSRKTKPAPRYRALQALSYPTDAAIIARLVAGEHLPFGLRGPIREVEPGEVVDDVPAVSVPWLIEQGVIEAVEEGRTDDEVR